MASLTSLLFKASQKQQNVDSELDDIFRTSAGSVQPPVIGSSNIADVPSKRKAVDNDPVVETSRKRGKLEVVKSIPSDNSSSGHDSSDGEDDDDAPLPVHISLLPSTKGDPRRKNQKSQFTPKDETPSQRDARTIFIGNLPVDVVKTKLARKQLIRHLTASVPGSKVESIRFRSVAFQNPTAALPHSDDEGLIKSKKPSQSHKEKELSTKEKRSKNRAASWREEQDQDAAAADANRKKQYLTPSEKKKIAFIHKEFHSDADSTNAYAVFAYPDPSVEDPVSPDDVAQRVTEICDSSLFMERTIRVDRVGASADMRTDTKRSIFVGNLDFAAKEEDLRVFFESLLSTERGPVPVSDEGIIKNWVTHVRLVRDSATQLGKGFAYVEFADRECVDEVLALEQTRLKFAKRKLRVQRCKTSQPKAVPKAKQSAESTGGNMKVKKILDPSHFVSMPNRDHAARAAELASLSKDERKTAKASDPDRIARRLQKKKARHVLAAGAVDASGGKGILGKKRPKTGHAMKAKSSRMRSESAMTKRNAKK